nr:transmembrane protein 106C [Ipomoea batatas]
MTSSRHSEPPPPSCSTQERYFHPLPAEPQTPQYIIVLPNYYRSHSYISRTCRRRLIYSAGLLLLAVTVFLLWPSDPGVSVSRLKLRGFRVHPFPPSLDISLDLIVKVQNRDFYSVDYNALIVSVAYRRKRLGYVTSEEGHLKARASSYINATLQLKGVEIITDVLPLIEDVARGSVTFDTVTEISGQLGLFLLDLPLQLWRKFVGVLTNLEIGRARRKEQRTLKITGRGEKMANIYYCNPRIGEIFGCTEIQKSGEHYLKILSRAGNKRARQTLDHSCANGMASDHQQLYTSNESIGDSVPEVNIIDATPNLENSSMAIPGLKHHQLSVLDALPAAKENH